MVRLFKKADAALAASILALAAALWLWLWLAPGMPGGARAARADGLGAGGEAAAVVYVDGRYYGELPLAGDSWLEVVGADGAVMNVVRVEGGAAYMSYASCPDGSCMRQSHIHADGGEGGEGDAGGGGRRAPLYLPRSIICLPNRVVVAAEPAGRHAQGDGAAAPRGGLGAPDAPDAPDAPGAPDAVSW